MMEIRKAVEADAPDIFSCVVEAFKDYILLINRTPGPMLEDYYEAIKKDYVFVVPSEDGIAGFAFLKEGDGDFMWLDVLASRPKYQGMGVGKKLLAFSEDFMRSLGKSECRIYTHVKYERVIALYRQLGYYEYERVLEYGYDRTYLKKEL